MRWRQLPRTYFAFVLIMVLGPLLVMVIQGDRIRPNRGLVFVALLLWGLGRGSLIAWILFLLWNLFLGFSVAAGSGGSLSVGAPLLLLVAAGSVALLVSRSMLVHVGVRRPRTADPGFG